MPAHALFPLTLVRTAGLPLAWLERLAGDFSAVLAALHGAENAEQAAAGALQTAFDQVLFALPDSPARTAVYNARRLFFQKRKLDVAARFPWAEVPALATAAATWQRARTALETARRDLREHYDTILHGSFAALQGLAGEEEFQRALLFSSHDLLTQIPDFQAADPERLNKKQRQAAFSLAQYAVRAATKTSPFSRLTTVSLLQPQQSEMPDFFQESKVAVTPNVALLPLLYDVLLRAPSFYRALTVSLNPCIVTAGNSPLTWLYFDGEQESFQEMPATPTVVFVVQTLLDAGRQLPFRALLAQLEIALDAPPTACENFLLELLDLGLLAWEWPEKGLSPGWCGALYQFLGFLPDAEPVIVEAAALLQWLRTAARTLPFQAVVEARDTQRETARQVRLFLEKYGGTDPGFSPEQLFYEDVESPVHAGVPPEVLRTLADRLADRWQEKAAHPQPGFKGKLWQFAQENSSGPADFLEFAKQFLETPSGKAVLAELPRYQGKIGALLQIFRENGAWRAVINGLFPGGGKLLARWLHLFPAHAREALEAWTLPTSNTPAHLPFPWQGWHNANFQPAPGGRSLAVPGGRLISRPAVLLGNLLVSAGASGLQLTDGPTGDPVRLTDLGLGAPETRPPTMQLLWHLGVPQVSLDVVAPGGTGWKTDEAGWQFRPRLEQDALVLARAMWQFSAAALRRDLPADATGCFFQLRKNLAEAGVPRQFFAHFPAEKPHYFDQDSPLLMQIFVKKLRQHDGTLVLAEMLPLPEQCFVAKNGAVCAAEFVVEFEG